MAIQTINDLNYSYYHAAESDRGYLLLHGIRGGIDESYTQVLANKLSSRGDSVLAINFPYLSRKENVTSDNLNEEVESLNTAYNFLHEQGKSQIRLIGKSLGGIVVSHWLERNPSVYDVAVGIMGYVSGEGNIIPSALKGKLHIVIQGEHDKYGDAEKVREDLMAHGVDGEVIEIHDADHSYRDINNPTVYPPLFQEKAIDELLRYI